MKAWIDEQLGRITMYRSVLYALIILSVMALVLMSVGNLPYSPVAFLTSLLVTVGVSYGSNRLFAWLFSIRPHSESALITGLILALLFIPADTALEFLKLAVVAVIAMASKYVLAPKGRHMFNPAAIAIVIASVSGLAYAGWWIATPGMIPVTLLVAAMLLYRTKKIRVGLVFIVTAVVFLWLRGTDPITALTSWPILFIAGIMLTEPLTLPPRSKQQYIVAVLIGVLMTQPFSYSRITMTPALAIVIGNLIGWWFGQRQSIRLRYVGKKQLNDSTYEFTFDAQKPRFTPGQYVELTLPHAHPDSRGSRRIFSIIGSPGDEQLSIGTKLPAKPSSFKRALMNLKVGETLYAMRISGDFVLPDDPKGPVICIAGGIGITPFISYYLSSDQPLQLIYAVKSTTELSFIDQLRHHANDVTVVSTDDGRLPDSDWKHVNGSLDKETLKRLIDPSRQPTVYVSGPPAMVDNVSDMVRSLGVHDVKVDEFSGY